MSIKIDEFFSCIPEWVRTLASQGKPGSEEEFSGAEFQRFPADLKDDILRIQSLTRVLIEAASNATELPPRIEESRKVLSQCVSFLKAKRHIVEGLGIEKSAIEKALEKIDRIVEQSDGVLKRKEPIGATEVPAAKKVATDVVEVSPERLAEIAQKKEDLVCEMAADTPENTKLRAAFPALYNVILTLVRDQLQKKDGTYVSGALSLRKARVFWDGMKLALRMGVHESHMQVFELSPRSREMFTWTAGKAPFLNMSFASKRAYTVSCTKEFYDFSPPGLYTDFANMRLGGGWLERGALQEESMVMEIIDCANYLAAHRGEGSLASRTNLFTRVPFDGSDQALEAAELPMQAQIMPRLLANMQRIREVGSKARGSNFEKATTDEEVYGALRPLKPQLVHILAMAAPRLAEPKPELQFAPETLKDILGTVMGGFTLAAEAKITPFVIHSGRLGCGFFNNNIRAVYVLQRIAAAHLGADLILHDYTPSMQAVCEKDWDELSRDLDGKPFSECIDIISKYFLTHPDPTPQEKGRAPSPSTGAAQKEAPAHRS